MFSLALTLAFISVFAPPPESPLKLVAEPSVEVRNGPLFPDEVPAVKAAVRKALLKAGWTISANRGVPGATLIVDRDQAQLRIEDAGRKLVHGSWAQVARPGRVRSWVAALRKLGKSKVNKDILVRVEPVSGRGFTLVRATSYAGKHTREIFNGPTPDRHIDACRPPFAVNAALTLALSRSGAVTRCHMWLPTHVLNGKNLQPCVCEALKKRAWGPGAKGRRIVVELR